MAKFLLYKCQMTTLAFLQSGCSVVSVSIRHSQMKTNVLILWIDCM